MLDRIVLDGRVPRVLFPPTWASVVADEAKRPTGALPQMNQDATTRAAREGNWRLPVQKLVVLCEQRARGALAGDCRYRRRQRRHLVLALQG